MSSRRPWSMAVSVVLLSVAASAQADEVGALRQDLAALRQEYEARIAALEARIAALGAPLLEPSPPPPPEPAVAAAAPAGSKVFNPDIAVIGDFLGAAGRNRAPGAPPALEMHEAEASFQAIVDPYARADFFLRSRPEGAEVEEGFLTFPTLPGGLLMKVGKMRGGFGKVNTMHNHVLPWTDRPLVDENLLGGEEGISDSGISRLAAHPESGRVPRGDGRGLPRRRRASSARRDARRPHLRRPPARLPRPHRIHEPRRRRLVRVAAATTAGPDFTTRLFGVDVTFRYRPLRRAIYRRLLARTELVWSRRDGPGRRRPTRSACTRRASTSSRGAGSPARATTTPSAPTRPRLADKGGSLAPHLLAERVQPDPRPVPPHPLRRGHHGQRAALPVPVLDRRPRRAHVLRRRPS